jgi:hypothetical protein
MIAVQFRAAARGDVHPGVHVGGIFNAGGDDHVAGGPVHGIGDEAEALGGAADEGDFGFVGMYKIGGGGADVLEGGPPAGIEIGAGFGLMGIVDQRLGGEGGGAGRRRRAGKSPRT